MSPTMCSGASRNTPTGSIPAWRAVPASGAASSAVTWRGLPGTKTKPANAAGRAARTSAPQFNPHNLTRPKTSSRAAWAGFGGAHQRRADEEGVDARREPFDVGARSRSRIRRRAGDPGASRASRSVVARSIERSRRSRLLMPISGAPSASARRISASSWTSTSASMPKRARLGDHRSRRVVVEQRQHHQHRVGAGDPRLGDLARIDEEVLGEDRSVELAAERPRDRRASRRNKARSHSTLSASATPA